MRRAFFSLVALTTAFLSTSAAATIEDIKARGVVRCAMFKDAAPFSAFADGGQWSGLGPDFCRSLAASTLGNPSAIALVPVSSDDQVVALQADEADILLTRGSWSVIDDVQSGFVSVAPLWLEKDGKNGVWLIVRQGDENWLLAVRLTLIALLKAEEQSITAKDSEQLVTDSGWAELARAGETIALASMWHARAVAASGNYAELVSRHLGSEISRGPNATVAAGGIHLLP